MLKAVRFDPEEHAELLEFIDNYRDKKNKTNHSEAIRVLMTKGLEAMNLQPVTNQSSIDIESIKKEILSQVMGQIQHLNIPQPQQEVKSEISKPREETHGVKPPPTTPRPPKPPSANVKPTSTNPLLANLLGNANR